MATPISECMGRVNAAGTVDVLHPDTGEAVTRLDVSGLYPVGSDTSVRYEHANGITITREDAERVGLAMDGDPALRTLRAIIEASGLSQVEWARTVAGRDPRTVRRWLAGDVIPDSVADWLARIGAVRVTASTVTVSVAR